jgi:hypothetical protein
VATANEKQTDGQDKELREFMRKDYEWRISYLNNHYSRMWTRFNYFVAIESALVGGKFLLDASKLSTELTVAGIVLSAAWYAMGAEDRYLARVYRKQVEEAGKQAADLTAGAGSSTSLPRKRCSNNTCRNRNSSWRVLRLESETELAYKSDDTFTVSIVKSKGPFTLSVDQTGNTTQSGKAGVVRFSASEEVQKFGIGFKYANVTFFGGEQETQLFRDVWI